MALRINTNVAALNAHRQLADTDARLRVSMERLSSGYRINKSMDDVAGLAIANKFRMEVRALRAAQQNVSQAQSLLQTAEGGASKVENIVERLKELAISAASSNTDDDGRLRLNAEAGALLAEIDQIALDTKYSGVSLLAAGISMTFQVGSGATAAEDRVSVTTTAGLLSSSLGSGGLASMSLTTVTGAQTALTSIDNALLSVNLVTGDIGAAASRIEFSAGNLQVAIENLDASHSAIRDVDMAFEITTMTKNQILLQAGTAMLAQANMLLQSVLFLLGGR